MSSPSRPRLALIAAVARNGIIGKDGKLPWHLSGDLKYFKSLTSGKRIIMGRRTWQSFPRPLPNREHVVVSSQALSLPSGVILVRSLADALSIPQPTEPVFVIGGNALYAEALGVADDLFLTELAVDAVGDTVFPHWDRAQFVERSRNAAEEIDATAGAAIRYDFVHYARR
jgi:dihydrofolate reductase